MLVSDLRGHGETPLSDPTTVRDGSGPALAQYVIDLMAVMGWSAWPLSGTTGGAHGVHAGCALPCEKAQPPNVQLVSPSCLVTELGSSSPTPMQNFVVGQSSAVILTA